MIAVIQQYPTPVVVRNRKEFGAPTGGDIVMELDFVKIDLFEHSWVARHFSEKLGD